MDQNGTVIRDRVLTTMLGIPSDTTTVTITWAAGCDVAATRKIGCTSTIKVGYPWSPITPVIGRIIGPVTVEASASMPLERIYSTP